MKWGRSMFYETKLPEGLSQAIENDLKRFLLDNFDQLKVESVSIGGQHLSNNIIFYDETRSRDAVVVDFIECFYDILDRHECYTNWYVSLHGHYVSVTERTGLTEVKFRCVHYKLEELTRDGYLSGRAGYLGRLNFDEVPSEKLAGINKKINSKHKTFLRGMR